MEKIFLPNPIQNYLLPSDADPLWDLSDGVCLLKRHGLKVHAKVIHGGDGSYLGLQFLAQPRMGWNLGATNIQIRSRSGLHLHPMEDDNQMRTLRVMRFAYIGEYHVEIPLLSGVHYDRARFTFQVELQQ